LPAALASVATISFFVFAEPIMAYEWRYLYPILPLWSALAATGAAFLLDRVARRLPAPGRGPAWSRLALLGVALQLLALLAYDLHRDASGIIAVRRSYAETLRRAHLAIARELAAVAAPGRTGVLAVADAGAIPYYSGWRAIDVVGLNDRHLALQGPDAAYVLDQTPDVVLLNSTSGERFVARQAWMDELWQACAAAGMVPFHVWRMKRDSYYVWMAGRPDNDVLQRLARRRSEASTTPEQRATCPACRSVWPVQVNAWFRPQDELVPFTIDGRFDCPRCGARIELPARG
jgi:hypothetical protein